MAKDIEQGGSSTIVSMCMICLIDPSYEIEAAQAGNARAIVHL